MTEPTTPEQEEADAYWQQIAPDGYELLLQAGEPQDDDESAFLWLAIGYYYLNQTTGRKIPAAALRGILDRALISGRGLTDALSRQLIDGAIKPQLWRVEMERLIRQGHLSGGAAAKGGWGQLTGADGKFLQQKIDAQLSFLDGFLDDIKTGKQRLNGNLIRRARMYNDASRGTYEAMRGRMHEQSGYNEERRVRGAKDSCVDCIEYASLGWQSIGTLPRIGDSQCRTNCRCSFEYRNAAGEVSA